MKNDLKELSNPKKYNNPISINNQDAKLKFVKVKSKTQYRY